MTEDPFTFTRFRPRVGEAFRVTDDDVAELELMLESVTELGAASPPDTTRTPFSAVFHGPLQPILPQRIYRLQNDAIGVIEIFIVPLGPAGDAMQYEAVFT